LFIINISYAQDDERPIYMTTYVDVLRIRNNPSLDGEIIGSIKRGEIVKVISIETNLPETEVTINGNDLLGYWASIEKSDKTTGYVFKPLLTDFIQYENILIIHDYDSVVVYKDLKEINQLTPKTEWNGEKYSEVVSILFQGNKYPFFVAQKRYIIFLPSTNSHPYVHGIFIYDPIDNKIYNIDCMIEGQFHGFSSSEKFMIFSFGFISAPRGTILYSFKSNEILFRGSVYKISDWKGDSIEFYLKSEDYKVTKRPKLDRGNYIDKYIFDNGIIKATDEYTIWKSDL